MTTGKGETRGMDSTPMTAPIGNRASFAAANSRKYAMGNTPDPCWCGCCDVKKEGN
jgi:hypothetical protein